MGNITSFSSPHRGSTTNNDNSDEPEEQQPTANYATVAEAAVAHAAAAEEAKVKAEQEQTSKSSPRRVKKEDAGVPLPSLNGLTAGRRKRTQTDFLSPTFTPQKRVKKEGGTAAATVKTEKTGEEETTPSRDGKVYAKYDKAWNNNYQLLANYKDEFGDCKVPPSYKVEDSDDEVTTIVSLGKWLENQKGFYKRNRLAKGRYDKLVQLGVVFPELETENTNGENNTPTSLGGKLTSLFSPKKEAAAVKKEGTKSVSPKVKLPWEAYRQQLISYKNAYGNCNVPTNHHDKHLAKWVENQKMFYRQEKLSQERITLLTDIGFQFTASKEQKWQTQYDNLVQFKNRFGHCNVPQQYGRNPTLGRWVGKQREKLNDGKLPKEHYKKLKKLGFFVDKDEVKESVDVNKSPAKKKKKYGKKKDVKMAGDAGLGAAKDEFEFDE